MIREIIDCAIKSDVGLSILYSKDGVKFKHFRLNSVRYSEKYGKNYIIGYCYDYSSELTFNVDRVINAVIDWVDVLSESADTTQDGLYYIAIRGDMCLGFELRQYKKDEWASYVTDIFHRDDDILAFHYIPYLNDGGSGEWIGFENIGKVLECGIYTFAYTLVDNKEQIGGEDLDYHVFDCPLRHNGIYYSDVTVCQDMPIEQFKLQGGIRVIAYNYCTIYNERDHKSHWDLVQKMGL